MNYDKVSMWVQVLGVVAIVASLGLVGVEIRQNTNAVAAQAVLGLNEQASQQNYSRATNPYVADLFLRAATAEKSLSAQDLHRFEDLAWVHFNGLESAFTFYQKGIIDESDYASWSLAACESWRGWRNFGPEHRQYFNPEFISDIESRCPGKADD